MSEHKVVLEAVERKDLEGLRTSLGRGADVNGKYKSGYYKVCY